MKKVRSTKNNSINFFIKLPLDLYLLVQKSYSSYNNTYCPRFKTHSLKELITLCFLYLTPNIYQA